MDKTKEEILLKAGWCSVRGDTNFTASLTAMQQYADQQVIKALKGLQTNGANIHTDKQGREFVYCEDLSNDINQQIKQYEDNSNG